MPVAAHARMAPAGGRPRLAPRPSPEPEALLAALMFVLVVIGCAALIMAVQADRSLATPAQRPVEGWVGTPDVRPVESDAPAALAPTVLPVDTSPPPPVEPARTEATLAVRGPARVANTAGRGVILHAEPRKGARTPAGLLEGARVTLLELAGEEWARVRSAQGQVGWVPTAYLAPTD